MSENDPMYYEVLFVVLDGKIDDLREETTEELIRSSKLPVSIIFIILGDQDLGNL